MTSDSDPEKPESTESRERPEGDRPQLTERQRAEARRRRRELERKRRQSDRGNALTRGLKATWREIQRTAIFLFGAVVAAFAATGPIGRGLRLVLAGVGSALAGLVRVVAVAIGSALSGIGRALSAGVPVLDRLVTPRRALVAAAILATVLLAVSQFTEYRTVEIGQSGYSPVEVAAVTDAPRVDTLNPIGTHSVPLLVAAVLALAGLAALVRSGRSRAALLPLLAGLLALVLSLAVDLPAGRSLGDSAAAYSGATAVLLSGFWLQLSTGLVLAVSGLLLLRTNAGSAETPRVRAPRAAGSPA